MAKVKGLTLSFPPSGSPDVVGYKMYIEESPNTVSYDSQSFDLGNNTTVDISSLAGMTTMDGVYNVGVTALDDAGNESSMSIANDIPLDFAAPNPPGELSFVAS